MSKAVLPGQTIGILGGGQLGRMLAMVARRSGYRVHILTPEENTPAAPFANHVTIAADDDMEMWHRFAESVDVVTFEFENLPLASVESIAGVVDVRPGVNVLRSSQNRSAEKSFLQSIGIPLARFALIDNVGSVEAAWNRAGSPSVLKTAGGGYDGKGQAVVRTIEELQVSFASLGRVPCTLESLVDLASEFSVIVARDVFGNVVTYGPIMNRHTSHILDVSYCPADIDQGLQETARQMAIRIAEQFELVGLICVEYFLTGQGEVLVNEIAPRPHNSGHLTIEGFSCSQFEQQLRTVCGLPVAPATQLRPVAMANLLGDVWQQGEPDWNALSLIPECRLHLYDKPDPRPGRKMGHITACHDSAPAAIQAVVAGRRALTAS